MGNPTTAGPLSYAKLLLSAWGLWGETERYRCTGSVFSKHCLTGRVTCKKGGSLGDDRATEEIHRPLQNAWFKFFQSSCPSLGGSPGWSPQLLASH